MFRSRYSVRLAPRTLFQSVRVSGTRDRQLAYCVRRFCFDRGLITGSNHTEGYGLRSKSRPNCNMAVTMSNEQFQQLLERLGGTATNQPPAGPPSGNFAKCSARFSGSKASDVSAFIDAVEIYKDCVQVSDQNALKGLPMLLDGFAATWYQGVKASVGTWAEAIA